MEIEDLAKDIENLAGMVQRGFKEQSGKLDEFKKEMYEFRDKTDASIFKIENNITSIFGRLDSIDNNLSEINPFLKLLKYNDRDLEKRVTKIENKLGMA